MEGNQVTSGFRSLPLYGFPFSLLPYPTDKKGGRSGLLVAAVSDMSLAPPVRPWKTPSVL